jgi:hypothetical protein
MAAANADSTTEPHHPGVPYIEKQNGPAAAARRVARLNAIGFDWGETRQSRWERMFVLLKRCVDKG